MRRQLRKTLVLVLVALTAAAGCNPAKPFYLRETGDLSHYLDKATEVEHPDVEAPHLAEVEHAEAPLTVTNPEFKEIWELGLEECMHIALQNSKVIRNAASIQANFGFSAALVDRTGQLPTVYDSALLESRTGGQAYQGRGAAGTTTFGSGLANSDFGPSPATRAEQVAGVESELAAFDAQFYSSYQYQNSNRPSNQQFTAFPGFSPLLRRNDLGTFEATMMKRSASGNLFRASSKTESEWSNQARFDQANGSGRVASGIFSTVAEFEARFPLMRDRGTQVNRIPVVLARINTDISLADFESSVRNMLMDTETAYWDLYFSYRSLEAAKIGRDSAQVTWKNIYEKRKFGALADQDEAQARGQYFQFRAQVEGSLRDVYSTETRLRWLMGLAATDGRLIRPKDEPTTARVEFEWAEVHAESLFRSTELRQQKWRIKQRELELISAKNTLLPWLSLTTTGRWVGVGDELIQSSRTGRDLAAPGNGNPNLGLGSTAFESLTGGEYGEAFVQLDFLPAQFGARRELASVRNAQLGLARAKAHLEDMELNQSHLMTSAIRELDANYTITQTNFNWWAATQKEVEAFETLYEGGKATLDLVLEAQRKRSQAQVQYYRSLTDYNKSLANVHYRKGSLLEHSNVFLTEGEWPVKAYEDAIEKARARDAAIYMNYGWTRPRVVSQGPVEQHTGTSEREAQSAEQRSAAPIPMSDDEEPAAEDEQGPPIGPVTEADSEQQPQLIQVSGSLRRVR
ncbi:MAG: TolC family protein [Pirellulales bacterium]